MLPLESAKVYSTQENQNLGLQRYLCVKTLFPFLLAILSISGIDQKPLRYEVPVGCAELALDEEQNFILLNPEQGEIYKLLAPDYDSMITAGGRGARTEGLLSPTKLEVFSRQRIYVLDEAQRGAVILSANLRPAEAIDFLDPNRPDEAPDFPIDLAVSPAGELYVLDGLNAKVYMYDAFGKLRLSFGGQDYGEGALFQPTAIDINHENREVWVLDTSQHKALVYSRFGEYLFNQDYNNQRGISRLHLGDFHRLFLGKMTTIIQSKQGNSFKTRIRMEDPWNEDMCISNKTLFVLRGNEVHLSSL